MAKLVPKSHPALHQIAEEVTDAEFQSGAVKKLIRDMRAALTSYNVEGFAAVAIAAPQIGISKRVFLVSDQSGEDDRLPELVAINPTITKAAKKKQLCGEGCLSVPELYGRVARATNVTLRARDEHGDVYERGAGGLLAQIFQHEVDHLDGTLFTDRAETVWHKDDEQHTKA